jgi:hypothetical protein
VTTPTQEQAAVVALARGGRDISVEALAGTGKTTTLRFVAAALRGRGQYVAFNRAIVDESKRSFPSHVKCDTAHGLAFASIGHRYAHRLNQTQRVTNRDLARLFDVPPLRVATKAGVRQLDEAQIARLALRTVRIFCKVPDRDLAAAHVPRVALFPPGSEAHAALVHAVLPVARRAWADLCALDGQLRFEHDHYLKLWQLSDPTIGRDFILFDEAQDADPVMLTVVNDQDAQLVYCGDRFQSIYEWRGAVNALEKVHVDETAWLTQSFRFGGAIADEANLLLDRLGAPHHLVGLASIDSRVRRLARPDAILCRTNGGVVAAVIDCLGQGLQPGVVGGVGVLIDFADACEVLMSGRRTGHPELAPFASWDEVLEWVADEPDEAAQIVTMVRLVQRYGPQQLTNYLRDCVDPEAAQVVVSTAHKAKGREWPTVRIGGDFQHPDDMDPEDLRLIYVAVTRTRLMLDLTEWRAVPPRSEALPVPPPEPSSSKRGRPKRPPIGR